MSSSQTARPLKLRRSAIRSSRSSLTEWVPCIPDAAPVKIRYQSSSCATLWTSQTQRQLAATVRVWRMEVASNMQKTADDRAAVRHTLDAGIQTDMEEPAAMTPPAKLFANAGTQCSALPRQENSPKRFRMVADPVTVGTMLPTASQVMSSAFKASAPMAPPPPPMPAAMSAAAAPSSSMMAPPPPPPPPPPLALLLGNAAGMRMPAGAKVRQGKGTGLKSWPDLFAPPFLRSILKPS
jgi:hypothetical protein